jgi:soluble lytic murein transglycosylase-like protein
MAHNRGSGCRGLMQLAPATAEDIGVRGAVANPGLLYDVNTNIRAGVRYLNWIANSFFRMNQDLSDVSRVPRERLNQILASYNWGIGNVRNVVRRYGAAALERVAPRETRDYISEIPGRIRSWVGSFFQ